MPDTTRSFAVIGLGTFGGTVATELSRFGNFVLGVDVAEKPVAAVADKLSQAVIADGTDEGALREAGVGKVDVGVVAIGADLEANTICTMNLKLLGVKTVWAKAMTRTHYRILTKIGADRVVQPELEVGQHIAQMLHNPALLDYVSLGNGFHVVNMAVPNTLEGKVLGDLKLAARHELRCLGLMRGSEFMAPDENAALVPDDRILLLGRRANLRVFGDSL
jgi:trk system potassium uptake protein TrkA